MSSGVVTAAYIVAAILFIFSLAGLSKHETSKQGNYFGIAGMAIALFATIFGPYADNVGWIIVAMVIGAVIGIRLAKKVEMTQMPELVAILHSFVGLAAVLVGFNGQHSSHRSLFRYLYRCGYFYWLYCRLWQTKWQNVIQTYDVA